MDGQTGYSRDATAMATAIKPLSRSLETFLTKMFRTNESSEKSKRVLKIPDVMKLHFEEEDLTKRPERSVLTSNLEGAALNCVMAKKHYQLVTAEKIFLILLKHFGRAAAHRETNAT